MRILSTQNTHLLLTTACQNDHVSLTLILLVGFILLYLIFSISKLYMSGLSLMLYLYESVT